MKKFLALSAALLIAASGLTGAQAANTTVSQYAASATATDSYANDPDFYSPSMATGAPDTIHCYYDDANSWATMAEDATASLTATFATPVVANQIKIWNSGGVPSTLTKVEVAGATGDNWYTVFSRAVADPISTGAGCNGDVTIPHILTSAVIKANGRAWPKQPVSRVRITLDQSVAKNWYGEIDALELTGVTPVSVKRTTAASIKSGSAKVGKKLLASLGVWSGSPAPTLTVAWYACSKNVSSTKTAVPSGCTAIAGAKSSSFTITKSQVGKYISVSVSASNGLDAPLVSFSKSSAKVSR